MTAIITIIIALIDRNHRLSELNQCPRPVVAAVYREWQLLCILNYRVNEGEQLNLYQSIA